MLNASPYIKTLIDWEGMDKDWGGSFIFVSQRPYKGKPEAGLGPGTTVTLQIMQDAHDHGVDKAGRPRDAPRQQRTGDLFRDDCGLLLSPAFY